MVSDTPVRAGLIPAVRSAAMHGDLARAERLVRSDPDENGSTPEALEALSWVARGALQQRRFPKASDSARQVRRSVLRKLRVIELDSEPHLAAALGAASEVLAQTMASQGDRAQAVGFLKRELARFGASSIRF